MATQTAIFGTQTFSTAPNSQITQNLSAESTLSVQQSWTEVRKLGRKKLALGMVFHLLAVFFQGFWDAGFHQTVRSWKTWLT